MAGWFDLRRPAVVCTGNQEVTFDLPKFRVQRTLSNTMLDVNLFLKVWREKVEKGCSAGKPAIETLEGIQARHRLESVLQTDHRYMLFDTW